MLFSFHLLETTPARGARLLSQRRASQRRAPSGPAGLRHAEPMTLMELGAPIVSPRRFQLRRLALFAAWDTDEHLDAFLADDPSGRLWAAGWHVRLEFLRRWGHVAAFDGLPVHGAAHDPDEPVVAVTLARLKLPRSCGSSGGADPSRSRSATTPVRRWRSPPAPLRERSRPSRSGRRPRR